VLLAYRFALARAPRPGDANRATEFLRRTEAIIDV
jgi:hypothetical protein